MVISAASTETLRKWRSHCRWRRALLGVIAFARLIEVVLMFLDGGVLGGRPHRLPRARSGAWSAGLAVKLTSGWPREWQRDLGWSIWGDLVPGYLSKARNAFVWMPVPAWDGAREFQIAFESIHHIEVAGLHGSAGLVLHAPEAEVWLFLKGVSPDQFGTEVDG